MQETMWHSTRAFHLIAAAVIIPLALVGCVSTDTHNKTLAELEALKKRSAAESQAKQAQSDHMQQQLASLKQQYDQEAAQRASAEARAAALAKEREALAARSTELQSRLAGLESEKGQLNSQLGDVRGLIKALEQKYASGTASAQGEIATLQKRAAELEAETARIAAEREQLRQEQSNLTADLDQERQRLKAEGAEKARLEQERTAKEDEIKRLTKTQEELSKSLQDEIAKGNITIQQVRDKLTINMVDRVLFDSGQAQVKPAGLKVLKQVSGVLTKISDKQIRIEGHTDNVPISSKLKDRFQSNWELSTARATSVVRYLIDHGGIDRQFLSAVGYADTHPIASNDSEEGRTSNRRIEIVLYPKDLSQVVASPRPDMH